VQPHGERVEHVAERPARARRPLPERRAQPLGPVPLLGGAQQPQRLGVGRGLLGGA
jgi:hypothetical protein